MARRPLVLALDQGTTSSRALVFDASGGVVASAQAEFPQLFPAEGWVEHDPEAIWATILATARAALTHAEGVGEGGQVVAIGLANQRETTLVWDRDDGRPIHRAIVWQDRRTARVCGDLAARGLAETVHARSGLRLDPYFSATKAAWILSHVEGARERANAGRLAFGTVDSFLIWRLTGGRVHATDATNASRTALYDLQEGDWSDDLCAIFDVPRAMLPAVQDCSADYGVTSAELFGRAIPILGVIGDQQAAAVGQRGFAPGDVKTTFGTGAFMLVNTGDRPVRSRHDLLTTLAYRLDGRSTYALEGSIFAAGATVQWLRDGLRLIDSVEQTAALASSLETNGGVYLVPAFTGLGAPHWDPHARGAVHGLTRSTGRAEFARAALEAVAYQTRDLVDAVEDDGIAPNAFKVDGGMAANDWLLQFLADITERAIDRPLNLETTAAGAAYMAGRACGVFGDEADFAKLAFASTRFEPRMASTRRAELLAGWRSAVGRTMSEARAHASD